MPQQTKVFRVFVSSTFSDMVSERQILQDRVFPRLERLCEINGAKFQAVDLRWGVNEYTQLNQRTMETCLNEIRRCQMVSPKPNFIILLSDRYGWQPVPAKIPCSEMEMILSCISGEERMFIESWYMRDDNAVPGEYVLLPRGESERDYQQWEPIENRLRKILRDGAVKLNFPEGALIKYTASATHQECILGALNPPDGHDNASNHVFAYGRNIRNLPHDASAKEFIDISCGAFDEDSHERLEKLKEDLKKILGESHFKEYNSEFKDGTLILDDEGWFSETVYNNLKSIIEEQIENLSSENEVKREVRLHNETRDKLKEHFTGREQALSVIGEYISRPLESSILSVIGQSGIGKSSIIAKAASDASCDNRFVVCRFLGTSSSSSNVVSMLQSLCRQIADNYGVELESLVDKGGDKSLYTYETLEYVFAKCLKLAAPENQMVIFLDALDKLSDIGDPGRMGWLPAALPPNVKLIVSSLPELKGRLSNSIKHTLSPMHKIEGSTLLCKWLMAEGRTLNDVQMEEVLSKFSSNGLPIYLKLAFEKVRHWYSFDEDVHIPEDISGILEEFFDALENEHTSGLVSTAVGYIISGKYEGLNEKEILELLALDERYWETFLKHCHPEHIKRVKESRQLPSIVWMRLYMDLEPYMAESDADGTSVLAFFHKHFTSYARERYAKSAYFHKKLSAYFESKPLFFDGQSREKPNMRKILEQTYQQIKGQEWQGLYDTLTDMDFIDAAANYVRKYPVSGRGYYYAGVHHLIGEYESAALLMAKAEGFINERRILAAFLEALKDSSSVLAKFPELTYQEIYPRLSSSIGSYKETISSYAAKLKDEADKLKQGLYKTYMGADNICGYFRDRHDRPKSDAPSKEGWLLKTNYTENDHSLFRFSAHNGSVNKLVYSEKLKLLYSCGDDGTLRVWDPDSGLMVNMKSLCIHPLVDMAYLKGCNQIIALCSSCGPMMLDAESLAVSWTCSEHKIFGTGAQLSCCGLAVSSHNDFVFFGRGPDLVIMDPAQKEKPVVIEDYSKYFSWQNGEDSIPEEMKYMAYNKNFGDISCIAVNPYNPSLVLVGCKNGLLLVLDLSIGKFVYLTQLPVSPENIIVQAGGRDVWISGKELSSGDYININLSSVSDNYFTPLYIHNTDKNDFAGIAVSCDGTMIAGFAWDKTFGLHGWNPKDPYIRDHIAFLDNTVIKARSAVFESQKRWVAIGDESGSIFIWDLSRLKDKKEEEYLTHGWKGGLLLDSPPRLVKISEKDNEINEIYQVEVADPGDKLSLKKWRFQETPLVEAFAAGGQCFVCKIILKGTNSVESMLAISLWRRWFGDNEKLKWIHPSHLAVYDLETEKEFDIFPVGRPLERLKHITVSSDGSILSVLTDRGRMIVRDLKSKRTILDTLVPSLSKVIPWGKHEEMMGPVIFGLSHNQLYDYEESAGFKPIWENPGPIELTACSLHTGSRHMLLGDKAGDMIYLDTEKCTEIWRIEAHRGSINSCAVGEGGLLAVTGGEDSLVCLWDINEHRLLAKASLGGPVRSVSLLEDGVFVSGTDHTGHIHCWQYIGEKLPLHVDRKYKNKEEV